MVVVRQKEEGYNLFMARYTGPRARVCRRLEFPVLNLLSSQVRGKTILLVNMVIQEEENYLIMVYN